MTLKQMFDEGKLVKIVDGCNTMTAQLIEKGGWDGIWYSSLVSSVLRGLPDKEKVNAHMIAQEIWFMREPLEMLDGSKNKKPKVTIPIVVDCDTGQGDAGTAADMVKILEHAGANACCFEDKVFPKDNSLLEGGKQRLETMPKFVEKIIACTEARKSEDFLIFARVEALVAGWGQEEAYIRAKAYEQAGADAIFIHSKSKNPDEILTFVNKWDGKIPLILCPTNYWGDKINTKTLRKISPKIAMVIFANYLLRAQMKITKHVLEKLLEDGTPHVLENEYGLFASMSEVFELNGTFSEKDKEKARLDKLKAMGYEL